uniref:Taste receptor type 2 n=1 Tax=Leptobrachium leishanense TaxID=445787 RepID=A0A8C5R830_9ANUR
MFELKFMFYALVLVMTAVDIITLTISMSGNLFIIVVNLLEWSKKKILNLSDQLITWIGASNMFYGFFRIILILFVVLDTSNILSAELWKRIYMMAHFVFISCNLWLCTWLCVHFCLKIIHLKKSFCISFQKGLYNVFPWIPIPSILGSLVVSFFVVWYNTEEFNPSKTVDNCLRNASETSGSDNNLLESYMIYGTFSSLAFLICLTSALSIIVSLCRHMKAMQDSGQSLESANCKGHIRVVKIVIALLSVNGFSYVAVTVAILKVCDPDVIHACAIASHIGHSLCPLILIKGNCKLYKTLVKMSSNLCTAPACIE